MSDHAASAWSETPDGYVHLESELLVSYDEGAWRVYDLEDCELYRGGFETRAAAVERVDSSFAENPRHSHNW